MLVPDMWTKDESQIKFWLLSLHTYPVMVDCLCAGIIVVLRLFKSVMDI